MSIAEPIVHRTPIEDAQPSPTGSPSTPKNRNPNEGPAMRDIPALSTGARWHCAVDCVVEIGLGGSCQRAALLFFWLGRGSVLLGIGGPETRKESALSTHRYTNTHAPHT